MASGPLSIRDRFDDAEVRFPSASKQAAWSGFQSRDVALELTAKGCSVALPENISESGLFFDVSFLPVTSSAKPAHVR